MLRGLARRAKWIGAALLLLGIGAWFSHTALLAWFYARQVALATAEDRPAWVVRTAGLDEAALPALLAWLDQDESACTNVELALLEMVRTWTDAERPTRLAERLQADYDKISLPGRAAALHVLAALLRRQSPSPPAVIRSAGAILDASARVEELRRPALLLAGALLERVSRGQWLDLCRALTAQGLGDAQPATRVAAAQVLLGEALRQDRALLGAVVPLLRDRSADVRCAALVALTPASEVVGTDTLLPLLHDEDPRVQQVCEAALRSRGLDENHLRLARLMSDESPAARLRVLQHLTRQPDLDVGLWLRRLTQDRAPAVRAAAVRAAGLNIDVDMTERLREMAEADPSETVRQNARHYLAQRQRVR